MQAVAAANNADEVINNNSDGELNDSDELFGLGSQADEETAEEGREDTVPGMELNGLYEFDLMVSNALIVSSILTNASHLDPTIL
jgi:hypothetical protein